MGQAKSWARVERSTLLDAPLPKATKTYTVISHKFVIDTIKKMLGEKGFSITNEIYCATDGAKVATGVFHINFGDDPELGMLFAFANSYDKSLKFRCSVGAYVKKTETSIITEEGSAWIRMHTGTADKEVEDTIKEQVENAQGYFQQLVVDKGNMQRVILSRKDFGELLGRLFVDDKILAIGQLNMAAKEYDKPSFDYTADENSLWVLYNHILLSLTKSHPKNWMRQQKLVHLHLMTNYDFVTFDDEPTIDPNQTSLIDQIEELEPEIPTQAAIDNNEFPEEEPEVLTKEDIEEAPDVRYADPVEMPNTRWLSKKEIVEEFGDVLSKDQLKVLGVVEKPAILMKDAVVKYADILTEDEVALLMSGKAEASLIQRLKDAHLADLQAQEEKPEPVQEAMHLDEEEDADAEEALTEIPPAQQISEEELSEQLHGVNNNEENITMTTSTLAEKTPEILGTDSPEEEAQVKEALIDAGLAKPAGNALPPMPGKAVVETPEVKSVVEEEDTSFSMTRSDVESILPEVDLELGLVVTIAEEECEITLLEDDHVELTPLAFDQPVTTKVIVDQTQDDHNAESQPPVSSTDEILEPEPQPIGSDFDIDSADEAVPSESMLRTKAQSVESLDEPEEEVTPEAQAAIEKMEATVDMTPAEKEIYDAIGVEILDIYGEDIAFTYKLSGGQYTVTLETSEVIVLKDTYVESLKTQV